MAPFEDPQVLVSGFKERIESLLVQGKFVSREMNENWLRRMTHRE
jgi:hypothetical protein